MVTLNVIDVIDLQIADVERRLQNANGIVDECRKVEVKSGYDDDIARQRNNFLFGLEVTRLSYLVSIAV